MGLSEEDKNRFKKSTMEQAESNIARERQWVESLAHTAKVLAIDTNQTTPEVEAVFWIRLHGVLTELTVKYRKSRDNYGSKLSVPIADALDSLKAELSSDELVYAQYRRDGQAHVSESGYELQVVGKGMDRLKSKRHFSTIGKDLNHDESGQSILSIIRRHPPNELMIAIEFATRLGPAIFILREAFVFFTELRD